MIEEIQKIIVSNRPNLSESSLKTYTSTIKNLYYKIYPDDKKDAIFTIAKLYDEKTVLNYLKDTPPNIRKSILSALISICSTIEQKQQYAIIMKEDIKKYELEQEKQIKNEKQAENWIDQSKLKEIFNSYNAKSVEIYKKYKKSNMVCDMKDIQELQNFVIICLTSGLFIPPRRSVDWCEMVIDPLDLENNVYTNKKNKSDFIFRKYKTAKIYNNQVLTVPKELNKILQQFIIFRSNYFNLPYLLFDTICHKLTSVKLNQRLNQIFDGKISVNALRHSFISDKYIGKPLPNIKEILNTSLSMAHAPMMHLKYIKNDATK